MEATLEHVSGLAAGASSALVASIWQGLLLAVWVGLCLRLVPRLSAATRSMVWFAVFVMVGGLDLVWLAEPAGRSSLGQGGAIHLDARWGLGLAAVWAGLTLVRLVRLAAGAVRLAGMARRATPLAAAMQVPSGSREPLVCRSTEVDRPEVVGFFAPRVLLPAGLCERMSAAEMEAVLLHEREHLRRGDDWTNLLQKIGLALMPLNPVLAWVERRLCRERELACDDSVLRQSKAQRGARKAYAACLARLAEDAMLRKPLALALGLAGHGSELARRVHRILAQPEAALGPRAAMGVSSVLIAGLLGGGLELARCPQMVRFSPRVTESVSAYPAISSSPAVTGKVFSDVTAGPRLVKAVATMDSPAPGGSAMERRRTVSRTARSIKARGGVRGRRGQGGGWIVMTRWTVENAQETAFVPVRFAVPAEYSVSSYATVPVGNGWLVFQL